MFATQRGHREEDRVPGLQHADQGRRHHRDQHPRRRRARRRARASTRATRSSWSRKAGLAVRFAESDAPRDGPRHERRARHGRRRARATRSSRWTSRATSMDLLVVTENGFGKRTLIARVPQDQPRRQGRARRSRLTEAKGDLAGALVVRAHQELVLHLRERDGAAHGGRAASASTGRAAQGVRVMNMREDDRVSAVAVVVESEGATAAKVARGGGGAPGRHVGRQRRVGAPGGLARRAVGSWRRRRRTRRSTPSTAVASLRLPEKGGGPYL